MVTVPGMLQSMTPTPATTRRGSSLLLVACLLGLVGAIWVLTLAGRGALAAPSVLDPAAWGPWATGRDAPTIAFAVMRLLTLALAWYLLGVTLFGGVARLARWRRMVAVADLLTVPALRRLLQSAFGVGLATAALAVGSPSPTPPAQPPTAATLKMTAEAQPPAAVMIPLPDAGETVRPAVDVPVPQPELQPEPGAEAEPRGQLWTVQPGDHFWSIATRMLADAWGRTPADAEVGGYWEAVIAVNTEQLVDPQNPDLIVPGQTFRLPPPPQRPEPVD